ncbi:unnamed protein product [Cyclocybe aegerita]|uniref:Uncharacterized protein n=1 Tax=Cyclocybe aegerita TaxID=1973307 RepID=A0A8S0XU95_CYCAE|nr:unnamed protein product [Cyclocybe aegerita]
MHPIIVLQPAYTIPRVIHPPFVRVATVGARTYIFCTREIDSAIVSTKGAPIKFPRSRSRVSAEERPLHFIGHSIGGPTIIKLQHLLNEGHFGKDGDPDMILSVNAVCAPFRGTQLVYTLGESTTSAPSVRALSIGAALSKLIHVLAYFSPILPASLDVHADARLLSYKESSFASFVKHLWKSDWAESEDAAPYDMTFEAADAREAALEGRVYPNTFYRSHVSRMTRKLDADPGDHRHPIGLFDYSVLKPPPSFSSIGTPGYKDDAMFPTERLEVEGEEYWANDGIVPVFSQWHPLSCG